MRLLLFKGEHLLAVCLHMRCLAQAFRAALSPRFPQQCTCVGRRQRAPHRGQAVHVLWRVLEHAVAAGRGRTGGQNIGWSCEAHALCCTQSTLHAQLMHHVQLAPTADMPLALGLPRKQPAHRPLLSSRANTGRLWKRRQPAAGQTAGGRLRQGRGTPLHCLHAPCAATKSRRETRQHELNQAFTGKHPWPMPNSPSVRTREDEGVAVLEDLGEPAMPLEPHLHEAQALLALLQPAHLRWREGARFQGEGKAR